MALVLDPVGIGLVKSLAQPGGNVTGLSMMTTELKTKRLQLLKEAKLGSDLKAIAPGVPGDATVVPAATPGRVRRYVGGGGGN
jgi:hypothetical protein